MDRGGIEERVRRTRDALRQERQRQNGGQQPSHGGLQELLAAAQGIYYTGTGIWPIVHMRSFTAVTGPKNDLWLVRTVGALITVIGGTLLRAGRRRQLTPELRLLAVTSAAALTLVDVIYVARRTIPPIYLLDAAAEVGLIAAWGVTERRRRRSGGPQRRRPPSHR